MCVSHVEPSMRPLQPWTLPRAVGPGSCELFWGVKLEEWPMRDQLQVTRRLHDTLKEQIAYTL